MSKSHNRKNWLTAYHRHDIICLGSKALEKFEVLKRSDDCVYSKCFEFLGFFFGSYKCGEVELGDVWVC